MHWRFSAAVATVALIAASTTAFAQAVSFSDNVFKPVDWTITNEVLNLGGSATGTQIGIGGTSGSYRQIVNTLNSAVGFGFSNTLYGFHAKAGATFDPSTSGPITSIDYSESSLRPTGSGQQACGLALMQGGTIYYGTAFLTPSTFDHWAPTSQLGLTAANFDALAPGVQNPNFTVTGGPIQFGFFRANSTSVGGGGGNVTGGIDDWFMKIQYNSAVPAHSTSWGRIKRMYSGAN
jgi:hypothetical protein